MKSIGYLWLILLFSSCHVVRVQTDYEKETDFSNYSTYNYYNDMETGLSELDQKRLIKTLDLAMQTKGFLLSEEPDFLVNIQSAIYQAPRNNTVGVGVGGTGRNVGGGVSVGIPVGQSNLQREIQFDFVDSQKDMLIWQAISKSHLNENATPVEREKKLQQVVEKVLSKYPARTRK
ncbi:MAG: DUF4136 domain-containing protein [Maribacter sp.]|nr:DUF4136 domain-containing protein [Maribacter sp.]MBT8313305.1 DUF4136 domain-containing protein [Maribacter sp.]